MIKKFYRNDSSQTITTERIDYVQKKIGSMKRTDEGFLQGNAAIAKTGILTYILKDGSTRRELVTEDTLFSEESMNSLKLKPVTNQHPKERMLNSKTVKKRKVGMTGENIKRDGEFLTTSLVITDSDAIKDIEGGTSELSPGYKVNLLLESGEFNGEKYDAIQLNRKYNHLATCNYARGGHDLKLNLDDKSRFDGFEVDIEYIKNKQNNELNVKGVKEMPKIKINSIDYDAAQEVINYIESLKNDSTSLKKENESLQAKHDKVLGENDSLKEDHKKLEDSIPSLISKGVKEKVAIDAACKSVLSEEEIKNLDGKSNDDIKKAIILKKYPESKLDDKSSAYIEGRFDSVIESINTDNSDDDKINKQRKVVNQNKYKSDNKNDNDDPYENMVKRDSELWKKDPNELK